MKRARTEQVQLATLTYLKKRGITDSETTFRENFKSEESLQEMAERLLQDEGIFCSDAVAFTCEKLADYFDAFENLRKFVESNIMSEKYTGLHDLLAPVFVHSYLDLAFADRSNEADEFYYNFAIDQISPDLQDLVVKLQSVRNANDLNKYFEIAKVRNSFCHVSLTEEERLLFIRFLQTQDNLLLMKIINERIRISVADNDIVVEPNESLDSLNDTPETTSSETTTPDISHSSKQLEYDAKIMISPPSLTQSTMNLAKPSTLSNEVTPLSSTMDMGTIRKLMSKVRALLPTEPTLTFYRFFDEERRITTVNISNSLKYIVAGLEDSSVQLWNVQRRGDAEAHPEPHKLPDAMPQACISEVNFGCDFLEDARERARESSRRQLTQLHGDASMTTLRGHSGAVYATCFTGDDAFLLSASEDTSVRLWDTSDLSNKVKYSGHNYPVFSLAISQHDMYFATGSMDSTSRLWSLERVYPLRVFAGHQEAVQSVDFHPNVNYLATADSTVRMWDINSGKTVRLMTGHWAPVMCLAFSPNGRWLASGGEDTRIRIWDIASGSLWKELRGHDDSVYSLHFSPDSSLMTSCGADSSVRVWNVNGSTTAVATANPSDNPHLISHRTLEHSYGVLCNRFAANNLLNCVALCK